MQGARKRNKGADARSEKGLVARAKGEEKIDQLVYDLYGLTQDERKIVEESVK